MTKFLKMGIRIRVTCVIVLTIMLFQSCHTIGAAKNLNPVCNTPVCQKLGKTLLDSMNKNVSACSNFYEYVCGQWIIQNPRPETYNVWTIQHVTEIEELKKLKVLLESTNISTPANEDIKGLYKTCMNLPYLERSPPDVISKIMTNVGHWPMLLPGNKDITVPWSVIDNEYIKKTGRSAIFELYIALGTGKLNNYFMPELSPLLSPYGTIYRTHGWGFTSSHKSHYKNSLKKIIELVAPANVKQFSSNIDKDLSAVINFREELREIIAKITTGSVQDMTVREFETLYDKQASKSDSAKIDWSQKISAIYKIMTDSPFQINPARTFVFVDKTYFSKLASLLKKTSKRVIANHIHLYFAERHLALPLDVKQEIRRSYGNEISTQSAIRADVPRWKWCITQHNKQGTMRNMYTDAFFPPTRKAEIEKLFVETKRLVNQQIIESTWLDKTMKDNTVDKINNMTSVIGYSVSTTDDGNIDVKLDPLESNVYYHRSENAVCVTAVSLQEPLYDLNVPYVFRYGATVAVFGHEVYHVFNRNALKYDCYGNKWWSSAMRQKFKEKVECFENQFEEKREWELRNHNITNWGILPDTTSEDIADIMGAKAAYNGYKQTLEKSKGICPVLPGFENMSCDQLFFIAFGHSLCSEHSDLGNMRLLLTDEHSTSRVRVNGIASNMKEFGTAFGCKPTDPMMQEKRCDMWQD